MIGDVNSIIGDDREPRNQSVVLNTWCLLIDHQSELYYNISTFNVK
ncbi:MAG: hypothetical protein J07HQW2_03401 [Haloquadratum walsbyi J07HQW2]|uniref:Uncharacterized protein n=1 Tax=Haloquadratum walsbyi J07HQW2 TaxID=1238425 RepID=U1PT04_9EURY|nr:MAG: hypothetical protein J07HQW2_03401 [Haloquadratum walsbyi J07HQW2]